MQIAVTFRHMETDEGVKDYVQDKVQRLQKYLENPREVHVVLSVEKFRHIAEIMITGNGLTLNSQGRNRDLYKAIDQMVVKMERQIHKRREKGRKKRPHSPLSKNLLPIGEDATEMRGEGDVSPVIKKRPTLAKPMSAEEAIAQLQLTDQDIIFFINSDSGQMNALSRCKDGSYEWI